MRAARGIRPAAPRDQRYRWARLSGAVCPARGTGAGAGLVLPLADGHAMNEPLAEIGRQVAPGAHAAVTLDAAGRHQPGGRRRVPGNISLLHLPPRAPGVNPVENARQFLRGAAPIEGNVWHFGKPVRNDLHPTMKPVVLVERAIRNSSKHAIACSILLVAPARR